MSTSTNAESELYVEHPDRTMVGALISQWGDVVGVHFPDGPVLRLSTRLGLPEDADDD